MTGLAALFQALQRGQQRPPDQMAPGAIPLGFYDAFPGLGGMKAPPVTTPPFRLLTDEAGPAPPTDTRALSALFEGKR